jgi:hypothetical protein
MQGIALDFSEQFHFCSPKSRSFTAPHFDAGHNVLSRKATQHHDLAVMNM